MKLTKAKARFILKEGTSNGKPLTLKQKKFFAWIAEGGVIKGRSKQKNKKTYAKTKKRKRS